MTNLRGTHLTPFLINSPLMTTHISSAIGLSCSEKDDVDDAVLLISSFLIHIRPAFRPTAEDKRTLGI